LILEALHLEEEARPDFKRINLAIDAAPNKMRRIVDDMIASDHDSEAMNVLKRATPYYDINFQNRMQWTRRPAVFSSEASCAGRSVH